MSPKSRLYNLVMAWKNKPFRQLRDIEQPYWESPKHEDQWLYDQCILLEKSDAELISLQKSFQRILDTSNDHLRKQINAPS